MKKQLFMQEQDGNGDSITEVAKKHISNGLSVIPLIGGTDKKMCKIPHLTKKEGEKKAQWEEYIHRPMTDEEVEFHFKGKKGLAIIGGEVSGGLCILDFEGKYDAHLMQRFIDKVEKEMPELDLTKFPFVKTVNNGWHMYFRCKRPN